MKVLKETGEYLEQNAKSNRDISIIFFIVGVIGLFFSYITNSGPTLLFIFILIIGFGIFKSYLNYSGGLKGENLVTEALYGLDDKYYLINDIKPSDCYGNIDHVVLGPNGIFVIETKNYVGEIICERDEWIRRYKGGFKTSMRGRSYWQPDRDYDMTSPSKQAKRNAVKIKQIIENSKISGKPLNVWIEGIVVFTNPDVQLQLSNPTIPILQVDELCDYIKNKKSIVRFYDQELESIGKVILKQSSYCE